MRPKSNYPEFHEEDLQCSGTLPAISSHERMFNSYEPACYILTQPTDTLSVHNTNIHGISQTAYSSSRLPSSGRDIPPFNEHFRTFPNATVSPYGIQNSHDVSGGQSGMYGIPASTCAVRYRDGIIGDGDYLVSANVQATSPTGIQTSQATAIDALWRDGQFSNSRGMQLGSGRDRLLNAPRNNVDSWVDELNDLQETSTNTMPADVSPNVTMAWLIQQSLPRVKIPVFDGSPSLWVEFVTRFRDLVHKQVYLNDSQRRIYLLQHVTGEAKRSIQGFADDKYGYVRSLKRLKFLFG